METVRQWPEISYRVNGESAMAGYDLIVEDDRIKGLTQTIGTINREQDAKGIVTACNSHKELLDALECSLSVMDGYCPDAEREIIASVRATFNKANNKAKVEGK